MITLQHMLTLSAVLFSLSIAGIFLNRKNVIILLMAIELMLLAVNLNFIAFWRFGPGGGEAGLVFVLFSIAVAAAEAAVGMALVIAVHRHLRTIRVAAANRLKG